MVIRPLNEEEKQFLNDFYAETIVTDFLHHPELKRLYHKKKQLINNDHIFELKAEIRELREEDPIKNKKRINELKKIIKITKKQNEDVYRDIIDEIDAEMEEVRKDVLLYPDKEDHKQFYGANNARNSCLYNKVKSMSRLIGFEPEDEDAFCSEKHRIHQGSTDIYEDRLIDDLERAKYEIEEERLRYVLEEESKESKNDPNQLKKD